MALGGMFAHAVCMAMAVSAACSTRFAPLRVREKAMGKPFKVGDHVTWNSEAGHVSGRIIKVHSKDVDYKGHTHHASEDEPQYEIKSVIRTTSRCIKDRP